MPGAEDLDPILHSFKNAQQLRVGVRDILGKDDVQATTGALSDVARVCMEQIIEREYRKLTPRLGEPTVQEGDRAGEPCELIVLAMGKFGGGELNYYSDLDVVFLYEADGSTVARGRRENTTSNAHFFSELGQRIIKVATYLGPFGRLYEIDARLRPTGRSGALSTSLAEFTRYFASGDGQLWERQALCKARVVFGSPRVQQMAEQAVNAAVFGAPFTDEDLGHIRDMRRRLEETAGPNNLKRGPGGLVDIEFLTQAWQLKYGAENHALRVPNTLLALAALHQTGRLPTDDYQTLSENYRFLRKIESRLRLMYASATNDLPSDPDDLTRLARGLDVADGQALQAACRRFTEQNRAIWLRYFGAGSAPLVQSQVRSRGSSSASTHLSGMVAEIGWGLALGGASAR